MGAGLVVKIAVGELDVERMQTGLSVAAAGCAAGVEVSLWLAGDAVRLAVSGDGFGAQPAELLEAVLQCSPVYVCARCADRRGITADDLRPGAQIAGAAAFVAAVTAPGVQALVY